MATDLFVMHNSCRYLEQVAESGPRYVERTFREHYAILNMQIVDLFEGCKKWENIEKNRYQNIECWNNTRVRLKKQGSNYIHANYVDGFDQVRKFIVTQEPMNNTLEDYWSMVWQAGTRVIVMLNGADSPAVPTVSDCFKLEGFTVSVKSIALQNEYVEMVMNVFNINTIRSRIVHCFKYLSWPKQGVTDMLTLINFINVVND
ncbi:tyrosine-protein phosphatase non-receptor type 9-like, partial [Cotesia glomerata]|uniref:tyrosine-protein phosphatase non-receptor type 9-like n=1 Tax=Cotesia glomerata TaxID=32391 RepID=UPI001D025DA2